MQHFDPTFPKVLCLLLLALVPLTAEAQGGRRGGRGGGFGGRGGGGGFSPGPIQLQPDFDNPDRQGYWRGGSFVEVPHWDINPAFKEDVFTFMRLEYLSGGNGRRARGGGWMTDAPDAEMNLTKRLHDVTSLLIRPGDPQRSLINSMRITPENLARFPFTYIVEPGRMFLREPEIRALRAYLQRGGFLMIDDFWGDAQWQNLYTQLKLVFPDREIKELTLEHPIFHSVFDLKEKPQMPNIRQYMTTGLTWEFWDYATDHDSHFYGIFDDKGRMMVFIGHNNDFGDGWEREGEDPTYFHTFSEKHAYPMFINILFYAMTH